MLAGTPFVIRLTMYHSAEQFLSEKIAFAGPWAFTACFALTK
jgi:hypothetical protein